jgi:uncharacterized membrane protein YbhN (UPF0104 family)
VKRASTPAGPQSLKAEPGRSLKHGLIYLALLGLLVVGLLLAIPGLHGVARTMSHMQGSWLAVAVGLEVLSCLSYVLAFLRIFELESTRLGARVALSELAFGAAVSLGGAGSMAIGSWLLIERGAPPARVVQRSAVLFLLTSAVNVITLVLFGIGLFIEVLPGPHWIFGLIPAAIGTAVFVLFLLLVGRAERMAERRPPGRTRTLLAELAASIRDTERLLLSPDWRLLGAIGYLWFDIGVLVACFAAIGTVPPLASIVLAYQIGYLANLLPIPGNVGVLDASLVGILVLYGVGATEATAATLVYHAIALWIPALWGSVAFLALRRSRGARLELSAWE